MLLDTSVSIQPPRNQEMLASSIASWYFHQRWVLELHLRVFLTFHTPGSLIDGDGTVCAKAQACTKDSCNNHPAATLVRSAIEAFCSRVISWLYRWVHILYILQISLLESEPRKLVDMLADSPVFMKDMQQGFLQPKQGV